MHGKGQIVCYKATLCSSKLISVIEAYFYIYHLEISSVSIMVNCFIETVSYSDLPLIDLISHRLIRYILYNCKDPNFSRSLYQWVISQRKTVCMQVINWQWN